MAADLVATTGARPARTVRRRGPATLAARWRPRCASALTALISVTALGVLAGCTSPGTGTPGPTTAATGASSEPVHLTLMALADPGLAPLLERYEAEHPGVTVSQTFETPGSEHLLDEVTAGHDLADVVLLEGRLGALMSRSGAFVDLREHGAEARRADFLDWTWAAATDPDGRVVGYGLTTQPMALCFRQDLLAESGIASDREELAAVLGADGGGWDVFFDVGRRYRQATGAAWFDRAEVLWTAMVRQLDIGYTTPGGAPADDDALRARWDLLGAAVTGGLSANQAAWDWDSGRSLVDGDFAVTPCTPWMLPLLVDATTAAGGGPVTGWDVVDVFPGGGAAWDGSYLAVTTSSEHPAEAAALIDWLTQPAQQLALHDGAFPAARAAMDTRAADAAPHPFFQGAPVDAIFASRALDVPVHAEGPDDWHLAREVFGPAVEALEAGADASSAWQQAIAQLTELGAT